MFRISDECVVLLLPGIADNRLSMRVCVPLSVRVQYVGANARPLLTWTCSCEHFHTYKDHCVRSSVDLYRSYPNHPACIHEEALVHKYGGTTSMLQALYSAPEVQLLGRR